MSGRAGSGNIRPTRNQVVTGLQAVGLLVPFSSFSATGCARFARLLGNQLTEITPACLESVIAYLHHSASAQSNLDLLARPSCGASQQGQYSACRAYKLGRGGWSYNQCELSLHQDGTESRSYHRLSALKAIYQKDVSAESHSTWGQVQATYKHLHLLHTCHHGLHVD